ncbi:hypothetical protein AKJ09_04865 [Labilithrix luteola]|uniref:Uncharacterized protein n=1 Tax=Labilithrix luteola TaxID=1391654 RepID=A0A0K1PXT6_9BACT|nr:hypothetical protein [Labilithrix luteola]AKU98201.1 hypothetical protein AKJ09_04865 [Labilithrix luteola]
MRWLAAIGALSVLPFLTVTLTGTRAHAEPHAPAAPDAPDSRLVRVVIGSDPNASATEATLRDLLEHLNAEPSKRVETTFETTSEIDARAITNPPAQPAPAFARIWLDVRGDVCVVSIADTSWERIYVRRVALSSGFDDVAREQVAHIVGSAVETLLAGGSIGVARQELTKPSPSPSPPAKVTPPKNLPATPPAIVGEDNHSHFAARLGAGYEVLAFSADHVAHGPWISLRGSLVRGPWQFGLVLTGQWRLPISIDQSPIGLRLDDIAFRPMLDLGRETDSRLTLHFGVGLGFDALGIDPRGATVQAGPNGEPAVTVEARRSRIAPILRTSVGLDVRITRGASIEIAGVLDYDPGNRSYFVQEGDRARNLLAPYALRPGIALGLIADLLPQ